MTALVTGATGAVGPALVAALLDAGWSVKALIRPSSARRLPDGVQGVEGDICDPAAMAQAVADVDVVFHLAALLHVADPALAIRDAQRRVNVEGTRTLVEAARAAHVSRIVLFSTIAVYGVSTGAPFCENQLCRPVTSYGLTKLAAERILLEAYNHEGQPLGVVLRLAAVYGPGIKGNYERLLNALTRGGFIGVGAGLNRRALVYTTDVARGALLSATHPSAPGRIFNLADGTPHTLREIIAAISAALPRRPLVFSLPAAPVASLATMIETVATRVGVSPPVRRSTIEKFLEDVTVDVSAIQRELGFVPRVDLVTGWRRVVESLHVGAP